MQNMMARSTLTQNWILMQAYHEQLVKKRGGFWRVSIQEEAI